MALKKKSKIRDPSYAVSVKGGRKHVGQIKLSYRLAQTGQIVSGTAAAGSTYVDLSEGLSAVNRVLHRQGRCYYISDASISATGGLPENYAASVEISTLPNTWVVANAWKMAFAAHQQMYKQVLEDTPSLKARWSDFKVFFNESHQAHYAAGYALPKPQTSVIGTWTEFTGGEWEYSEFVQPDHTTGGTANEYWGHMLGVNNGTTWSNMVSAGLCFAYQQSRVEVQAKETPANVGDGMYANLFDLGGQQEDLTDLIVGENATGPYDMDNLQDVLTTSPNGLPAGYLSINNGLPIASMGSIVAPLGLLRVQWFNGDTSYPLNLNVTLTPGKVKGIHSEPMGQ
jgi:hypothetical protein